MEADVDDYAADHRSADAAEWRALTDAAAAFVEADASGNAAGGSPSRRLARRAEPVAMDLNPSVDVRKTAAAAAAPWPARAPPPGRCRAVRRVSVAGAVRGLGPGRVPRAQGVRVGVDARKIARARPAAATRETRETRETRSASARRPRRARWRRRRRARRRPSTLAHHSRSRGGSLQQRGRFFCVRRVHSGGEPRRRRRARARPRAARPRAREARGASDFSRRDDEEGKDPLGFATARIASASPRKYAVREASARQFLLAAATAGEELGRDEMLLLYLSGGADFAARADATTNPGACPGVRLGTGAPSRGAAPRATSRATSRR